MFNYYVAGDGELGFGVDKEDAENDLYINICKRDMSLDSKCLFTKRREDLHPWFPTKNILHICGIGAIMYNGVELVNTKTNKSVAIGGGGPDIYWYLSRVLGDEVSYTDICVCMREEINTLFNSISSKFVPLDEMPYIRIFGSANGFTPDVVYTLHGRYDIGISNSFIGIKRCTDDMYHAVEVENRMTYASMLAYIGYKMGIVFTEKGVLYCGKETEELG